MQDTSPAERVEGWRSGVSGACWVLASIAIAVLSVLSFQPRSVLTADADTQSFSAARAMAHVRAIAGAPRPSGSREHAHARDHIVETLRGLGLEPRVEARTATSARYGVPFDSASVENVVAVMPGSDPDVPIVLMCHADTVPTSPGAADDGAGVATLLETARALATGPSLRRDVVFLFTDAEEAGALGAEAHIAADPRSADAIVLNFDARGTGGPVGLIETGGGSGALVRELARLDVTPAASSLLPALARLHGLGTDFRPFREAGARGLSFAFVDGVAYYHTPKDDASVLDERSLQQQGDVAVGLARGLGARPTLDASPDPIFFPVPGVGIVRVARLAIVLAAVVSALAFVGLAFAALRSGGAGVRETLAGVGAALLVVAVSALACYAVWRGVHALDATAGFLRTDDTYRPGPYRAGLVLCALAAALAGYAVARRVVGLAAAALAIGAVWAALALASAFALPGASYVFVLPFPIFCLAAFLLLRPRERALPPSSWWARSAVAALGAVPAIVLWAPIPTFLFVGLQLSAAPAVAVAVALPALLVAATLEASGVRLGGRWASVAGVVGIALCCYGIGIARFDAARPKPVSLAYALDRETGRAFWIADRSTRDETTDPYFARTVATADLPTFFSETDTARRAGEADAVDVEGPELVLLDDTTTGARRTLRFRLRSRRGAPWATAILESKTHVLETSVDGVPVTGDDVAAPPPDGTLWGFRHLGLPPDGIEWTLTVERSDDPVRVAVVDQSPGIVTRDGTALALPEGVMFARSWTSGTTLVRSAFVF